MAGGMALDGGDGGGGGIGGGAFDHLLRMPLVSLTAERVAQLEKQVGHKEQQVRELSATTELQLWKRELEKLRPALEAYIQEQESAV